MIRPDSPSRSAIGMGLQYGMSVCVLLSLGRNRQTKQSVIYEGLWKPNQSVLSKAIQTLGQ